VKTLLRFGVIFLLALISFVLGANQYRLSGWPFGQGIFVGAWREEIKNKSKERDRQVALWSEKLKKGGYILYMRHANREKWHNFVAFDVYALKSNVQDASQTSFKRAVCLSEQGVEEAKMIGKIFELAKIPVGTVVSSPSCRAKQTAAYAFGRFDRVEDSLLFPGLRSKNEPQESSDQLIRLLSKVEIKPDTNTVISAHGGTLEAYMGGAITGDTSKVNETGFHIIERRSDGKLVIVFNFESIMELAINVINSPQQ
jgi:phosphohistidine phosphatase SixA